MNYKQKAKMKFGKKSEWITGDGRYALLAHCGVLTVTLHPTMESANESKKFIDKFGCGGKCCENHETLDLEAA